jgi:SAM-dependent methyltransferase
VFIWGRVLRGRLQPANRMETALSWIWTALLLILAANAGQLRQRARALRALQPSGEPVDAEHVFLIADGVELSESTRRAASAHARANRLQVLDLIPADLPVDCALYLLTLASPATYAGDLFGAGRGAGCAILVSRDVLRRARLDTAGGDAARVDPASFARITGQLRPYAVGSADLAVAPDLRASSLGGADPGREFWSHTLAGAVPFMAAVAWIGAAFLVLGPWLAPLSGGLALVAFHLQPWLITGGSALRPRDLWIACLARSVWAPWAAVQLLRARQRAPAPAADLRAAQYAERLAHGTARFFEPRRDDCPLCGARAPSVMLRFPDRLQHKPGEFTLERCSGCGHIFQNPRLSFEGLDFYYADFYSGTGESIMDLVFSATDREYRARAEVVARWGAPGNWLDVGTGHGHFCLRARQIWPDTQFDGLDMSESIEEAERRGWIRRGHRGQFPQIADQLKGAYDVVSMHHYLEHVREPLQELAAAAIALRPGGLLSIEVPNPECRYGRVLGTRWLSWFQPQHQHFLSPANLRRALEQRGFDVLLEQRGPCHIPAELTFLVFSFLNTIAPPVDLPWLPPVPAWKRLWHVSALSLGAPLLVAGALADRLLRVAAERWDWPSNAFRIVARRRES